MGSLRKKPQTVGYRYHMGLHMVTCLAPITALIKIIIGERVAWEGRVTDNQTVRINKPNLFGGDKKEGGIVGNLHVLFGADGQPIHPFTKQSIAKKPENGVAFRGVFSLIWNGMVSALHPRAKPWSIVVENYSADWYPEKAQVGQGMNPAHIIRNVLSRMDYGIGYPSSQIDERSFADSADALFDEGFGLSVSWENQTSVQDFLQMILDHCGAVLLVSPDGGKFLLKLIRGDYDVDSLPAFTPTEIISLDEYKVAGWGEAVNEITVIYTNPKTFKKASVTVQDQASIDALGGSVIAEKKEYMGITDQKLAKRIGMRDLGAKSTPLSKIEITVNRRPSALNVCDVFTLSWPELGIEKVVYRILSITTGTITSPEIRITAAQDVFGLAATSYVDEQDSLWEPLDVEPQPITNARVFELPYILIANTLSVAELKEIDVDECFVAALAESPSGGHHSYDMVQGETVTQGAQFSEHRTLDKALDQITEEVVLSSSLTVTKGDWLFAGDEILYVISDASSNTITANRGMFDTVPLNHSAGDSIWIMPPEYITPFEEDYSIREAPPVRLASRTTIDVYPYDTSPSFSSKRLRGRFAAPYPAGNFKIDDESYPSKIKKGSAIQLTWAHRNREQQTAPTPVTQRMGSLTPPENISYRVEVALIDSNDLVGAAIYNFETDKSVSTHELANDVLDAVSVGTKIRIGIITEETKASASGSAYTLQSAMNHSIMTVVDENDN